MSTVVKILTKNGFRELAACLFNNFGSKPFKSISKKFIMLFIVDCIKYIFRDYAC